MTVATLMCAPSVRSGRWSTDDGACEPVLNAVLLSGTSEDMADPSHRTTFVTLNELHAVVGDDHVDSARSRLDQHAQEGCRGERGHPPLDAGKHQL